MIEFKLWKQGVSPPSAGFLAVLRDRVKLVPVSSAEAERGFSAANLIWTDTRNAFHTVSVSNLLTLKLNGPPIEHFDSGRYVTSWLQQHRSATSQNRVEQLPFSCREQNRITIFGRK